ncbi:MAG: M23 family metallopeptidase [Clostridiales bacterium]|nr:M23 family metallopeptidase [Clostridiales bacterium]
MRNYSKRLILTKNIGHIILIFSICLFMTGCRDKSQPELMPLAQPDFATGHMSPIYEVNTDGEKSTEGIIPLSESQPEPESEPEPKPEPKPEPEPEPKPEPKPEQQARLSVYEACQGQLMGFQMTCAEESVHYELTATHLKDRIETFHVDSNLLALIQVAPDAKPGLHMLTVKRIAGQEKLTLFELTYEIKEVAFTRQDLTVTEDLAEIRTDNNIALDNKKVGPAKAYSAPKPLWEGPFIQPLEGRISTQFGQVRYTNGKFTSRHSAIDIAATEGTPVQAAAAGQVVFADELIVSGNTVIIDHGLWLFTTYCHMSALDVEVGDKINAGDIIGKVGATGYATGPHLHYAASIKSARVNPDLLKEQDPLDFSVDALLDNDPGDKN